MACYSSVWLTAYGFLDDYAILAESLQGEADIRQLVVAAGRPTYALLLALTFPLLHSVADLRYIRLLGVLGLALLSWRVYRTLVRAGWGEVRAFLLALVVVMMPAFQVYAAWATTAFHAYAALLAGGAWAVAERALTAQRLAPAWSLAGGASLLLLALTIHQSAALFFWVFAAVMLCKPDITLAEMKQRFLWYNTVVFIGLTLGFGLHKLGTTLYPVALEPARTRLTHDVWGKVLWFVDHPLKDALNISRLSSDWWLALPVAAFMVGGLVCFFRGDIKARLWQLLIALAVLPLAYLPNLVVTENWSSYRTQAALTSLVVLYIFVACWGYRRCFPQGVPVTILTTILGLAALASGLAASSNVTAYFVAPQWQEWHFLRAQLARADLSQAHHLYLIASTWQRTLAPGVRYDEFGFPSSAAPWTLKPMVYLFLRERYPEHRYSATNLTSAETSWVVGKTSPGQAKIAIDLAPPTGDIHPSPDALVLDMRQLGGTR